MAGAVSESLKHETTMDQALNHVNTMLLIEYQLI